MREPLPIDAVIPDALVALRERNALVLEAPPGAGKTTRVPVAMLEAGIAGERDVWVLQPRRLAARLAATRVAEELGERPGETVGWQVRFEEVAGPKTKLRFLTEGVLTRRLLNEPDLPRVGAVVLDEFHERHLDGDLALALLRRLQGKRPDLKLVVMSATLDAGPIAQWLGAPSLRSEGKRFDVAIEHLEREDPSLPLERQVSAAVKRLVTEGIDGHVLVFLPGAAEIRRAGEALAEFASRHGLLVLPLHGELPPAEQDRAVRPSKQRKVILSTNVAETSVTIDGVVAVVDAGLARVASLAAWSGIPVLKVAKVSKASATQRAGRAGRTRPGRALRLYTKHDFDTRAEHDAPEIRRLDLAETVLALASHGVRAEDVAWFEPPPAGSLAAARGLLERLGAIDARGAITELGRRMLRFPVHPRLSRLVLEAHARGAGELGCAIAALAGERDIRTREEQKAHRAGTSDLLTISELLESAGADRERARSLGLDPNAVATVQRVRQQLARIIAREPGGGAAKDDEEAVLLATLAAFPDRVARKRGDDLALAGGGAARLALSSVVRDAELLVCVDAQERREGTGASRVVVRSASLVEPEWLLDLFPERVTEESAPQWNAQAERVESWSRLLYEGLVIEESRGGGDAAAVTRVLAENALAKGPRAFAEDLDRLFARVAFVREACPDAKIPPLGDAEARETLASLCEGRKSFAELREARLAENLLARFSPEERRALERLAPERVTLPGGRSTRIEYERGKPPWIASRLQDFFGMAQGPAVANGRVFVVLHLLAPNQRDLQVTTDLAGFWDRHYPAIRKELMRKYPKHAWPEDPRTATPPKGGRPR